MAAGNRVVIGVLERAEIEAFGREFVGDSVEVRTSARQFPFETPRRALIVGRLLGIVDDRMVVSVGGHIAYAVPVDEIVGCELH